MTQMQPGGYAEREVIRQSGRRVEVRYLTGDELKAALGAKLIEEAQEAAEVVQSRADLVEELADVREVVAAIMAAGGITEQELAEAGFSKAQERGSFRSGAWLDSSSFTTD